MDRVGKHLSLHEMKQLHENGSISYELGRPAMKDTVIVPDGGYTVVRFFTDNPGFWAFHCHLSFHLEVGMMMVIQVGETDQMNSVPEGYPKCGSWPNSSSVATNLVQRDSVISLSIIAVFVLIWIK